MNALKDLMNNAVQDISTEARAVTVQRRLHRDHHDHNVEEVNFQVPDSDFSIGTKVKNGKMVLLHIGSPSDDHAKKGHGFATMQRAVKYAADNGLRFFVNEFVPSQAQPLVHKLVRHGYDIREPVHPLGRPSLEIGTTGKSFTPFECDWL